MQKYGLYVRIYNTLNVVYVPELFIKMLKKVKLSFGGKISDLAAVNQFSVSSYHEFSASV